MVSLFKLFFFSFFALTLSASPLTESTSKHLKYAPNARGVNRSYYTILQDSLFESMLKVNMGGKPDCIKEGMNIARNAYKLTTQAYEDETGETSRYASAAWMELIKRCNYIASVEGIMANKMIRNYIHSMNISDAYKGLANVLLIGIEIIGNAVDNLMMFFSAYQGF